MKVLRENHRITQTASDRIGHLVRSLRNFARLDEAQLQHADIHEGFESALMLLGHRFTDRITVHKTFSEIPRLRCYPGRLNQVFMHFLTNAIDAIETPGDVWITTWQDNNVVKISIRDNGKGIGKDMLPKIFDPFFTLKPAGGGTGLGLAVSHQIISQHGGTIEVESEVGKGTEFVVTLPI